MLALSEDRQLVVELPNGTRAMLEESWIGHGTVVATLDSAEPGNEFNNYEGCNLRQPVIEAHSLHLSSSFNPLQVPEH